MYFTDPPPPPPFTTFFNNIAPIVYMVNRKMNSWGTVMFFMFRRLQSNVECFFFYKHHFYMQYGAKIWFKIIAVLCITCCKKNNNNKHCTWNICWGRNIIATKSIHHSQKAVLTLLLWTTPYMDYLYDFLKISTSYK